MQELNRTGVAHVLVHEITHVIEGVTRHSASGIMKARWDTRDYFDMRRRPHAFAQEDVSLIYDGLKIPRVASAAMLTSVARAAVAGQ
jgi:hypothetical protein